MRILHVSWEYPPVVFGGLGRHVHALAEAQAAAGHDVVVLTQQGGDEALPLDERVHGVRVVRAPHDPPRIPMEQFLSAILALDHELTRAAIRLSRTWTPEVVHAHDWLVAHTAITARELFGVPIVATVHATEAGRHQGWLPGPHSGEIHQLEWWFTHEARRVITCSRSMRAEITQLFDVHREKVAVIPNGIDVAAWTAGPAAVAAARSRYAATGPLVVFTGRLEYEKGVHTLVDAFPRLRRRFPGIRLVVVGRGGWQTQLEEQVARLRLGRSVEFAGWLTESELCAVTAAADVAVVPSVYEPFGMVALEAAALGTPLVASDTGGLAEIVAHGETGLLVPALDPAALADAITTLLRDDLLARRLAHAARDVLESRYSWAAIAESTCATYVTAVDEERRSISDGVEVSPLHLAVRGGNLLGRSS